jgi:hypothetical protein
MRPSAPPLGAAVALGEPPAQRELPEDAGRQPPGLGDLPRAARGASRAPARASRRARAGDAGGGRAAIVASLQCSSSRGPAASAAPSHAGGEPGPGVATGGISCCSESAQTPSRSAPPLRSEPSLSFKIRKKKKKVPPPTRVCVCARARARLWHGPALTVAINEQTVRVGAGTSKIVRESRQACEMDPRPTVTVLITTEQISVSPAPRPPAASRGS